MHAYALLELSLLQGICNALESKSMGITVYGLASMQIDIDELARPRHIAGSFKAEKGSVALLYKQWHCHSCSYSMSKIADLL